MVAAPLADHAPLSVHPCVAAFFARYVCAISGTIWQLFGRDPNYLAAHKSYQVLCNCESLIGKGSVIDKGRSYHICICRLDVLLLGGNNFLLTSINKIHTLQQKYFIEN
jgi:hypothetical protein